MERAFAYPSGRRVHYRHAGSGPPLVMLHGATGTSGTLEPLARELARSRTVIAIDLPGFGESEPLPGVPDVAGYALTVLETLEALGVEVFDLHGTRLGGSVAIALAAAYPDRVRRLVLEGFALYSASERDELLARFAPDLAPRWDGTHLLTAWAWLRDQHLFWPWYRRVPAARLRRPLPSPDALHDHFVEFMRGMTGYEQGFRIALRDSLADDLAALQTPALAVASADDPLQLFLDRLGKASSVVTVAPVAAGRTAVAAAIEAFLAEDQQCPTPGPPHPVAWGPGVIRRSFTPTPSGPMLTRRSGTRTRRPLVLFHAAPGSSSYFEPLMLRLGHDRPVITFDNPGNGDSAPIHGNPGIADLERILGHALDQLGLDEFDVYGSHTGALIAMEAAIRMPQRVKHVILDGITLFTPEQTREYLDRYPVPLRITTEGSHLLWAWNFRRDMGLWWPYYNHTMGGFRPEGAVGSPEAQHAGYVEFMKGGRTYHLSYRAAFAYDTRSRLPLITQPVLHCSSESDPLRTAIPEAMSLTASAVARVHQGNGADATLDLYRRFLADQPLPPGPEV